MTIDADEEDPLTNIVVHGHEMFSQSVSALVRQIARLADERTVRALGDLLALRHEEGPRADVRDLEAYLVALLNNVAEAARVRDSGAGDRGST